MLLIRFSSAIRKISSKSEHGAVLVETALALPLAFGLLFTLQDSIVLAYNNMMMRYVAQETARFGLVGPEGFGCTDRTTCDTYQYLSDTENFGSQLAQNLGIADSNGFMDNNANLYDGTIQITAAEENPSSATSPTSCNDSGPSISEPCYLVVTVTKTINISPITGVLFSMAHGNSHGDIKLSVTAKVGLET